jgi:hypothetical protein
MVFACIVTVVAINAAEYKKHKSESALWNPYTAVAAGMGLAIVVTGGARWDLGWRHWTIAIETADRAVRRLLGCASERTVGRRAPGQDAVTRKRLWICTCRTRPALAWRKVFATHSGCWCDCTALLPVSIGFLPALCQPVRATIVRAESCLHVGGMRACGRRPSDRLAAPPDMEQDDPYVPGRPPRPAL